MNPFSFKRSLLLVLAWLTISSLFCSGSALAKEITYTTKFGPAMSRTVLSPGDRPGHELVQAIRTGLTNSSDPDWNDAPVINYGQSDVVDGTGSIAGYAVRTHRNGDKTFYRFEGTVKAGADGKDTVGEGTVELLGGTGKFASARGRGSYSSAAGVSTIKLDFAY